MRRSRRPAAAPDADRRGYQHARQTDLIVTGDKAMQKLGSFRGIPIVSAVRFVARLQQGHQATRPERADVLIRRSPAVARLALLRHLAH